MTAVLRVPDSPGQGNREESITMCATPVPDKRLNATVTSRGVYSVIHPVLPSQFMTLDIPPRPAD